MYYTYFAFGTFHFRKKEIQLLGSGLIMITLLSYIRLADFDDIEIGTFLVKNFLLTRVSDPAGVDPVPTFDSKKKTGCQI